MIATAVTVMLLASAAGDQPAPDSEEQLVIDVKAMLADPVNRPPVEPAVDGTFGELAAPHLASLQASYDRVRAAPADQHALDPDILDGRKPLSALPSVWKAEMNTERNDVFAILRATHARAARLPLPLTMFGLFSKAKQPFDAIALLQTAKVAGLLALLALEEKDVDRAASICVDDVALVHDFAHGDLVNQLVASTALQTIAPSCHAVIAKADAPMRARLARDLAIAAANWTPFRATLQTERVFGQIGPFRDSLSAATVAALPPEADISMGKTSEISAFAHARRALFAGWARRTWLDEMTELQKAAELRPKQGDAVFERYDEHSESFASTLAAYDDDTQSKFVAYVRRHRLGQARVLMLQAELSVRAARDRLGHGPSSWQEAGIAAPVDPRTALAIELIPTANGVRLAPVNDGERTGDDLSINVQ